VPDTRLALKKKMKEEGYLVGGGEDVGLCLLLLDASVGVLVAGDGLANGHPLELHIPE
jgi:hypothetical protein